MEKVTSMKGLFSLPLRHKFYLFSTIFLIVGAVVFYFFFHTTAEVKRNITMVNVSGSARMQMYRLLYTLKDLEKKGSYTLTEEKTKKLRDRMVKYDSTLHTIEKYLNEGPISMGPYISNSNKLIGTLLVKWPEFKGPLETFLADPRDFKKLVDNIGPLGEEMVVTTDKLVTQIELHNSRELDIANVVLVILLVISVVFIAIILYLLIRYLISPLARIEIFANRMAAGDLTARLDYKSNDEVGAVVDTMNKMAAELEDLYATMEVKIEEKSTQLARVEKFAEMGHIAAGVAHEVNNPLAAIQVCVESLLRKLKPGDMKDKDKFSSLKSYLEIINNEVVRCGAITMGLLDYSRERAPTTKNVNMRRLLEEATKILKMQKAYNIAVVEYDIVDDNIDVSCDEGQLTQVFMNLIKNGLDAMGRKGVLKVSTTPVTRNGAQMLAIKFKDTGSGIDPRDMESIFKPFFTTKHNEGTGLGLSVCEKIIHAHNGTIEVESVYAKGTTFTIYIPLENIKLKATVQSPALYSN